MNIKELLDFPDLDIDDFWSVVGSLPDEGETGNHKKNINSIFKNNGELKARYINRNTDLDIQMFHKTQGFIRKQIRTLLHINKMKEQRDKRKQEIREAKGSKELRKEIGNEE